MSYADELLKRYRAQDSANGLPPQPQPTAEPLSEDPALQGSMTSEPGAGGLQGSLEKTGEGLQGSLALESATNEGGLRGTMERTGEGGLQGDLRLEPDTRGLQGSLEKSGEGLQGSAKRTGDGSMESALLARYAAEDAQRRAYTSEEEQRRLGELLRWRYENETRAPEEQAEILRLSAATGWNPQTVADDLPRARARVEADGLDVQAVLKAHPALAEFLGDPQTSALARSDTARLTGLAYLIGGTVDGKEAPGAVELWWRQRQLARENVELQRQLLTGEVEDATPPAGADAGELAFGAVAYAGGPRKRPITVEERKAIEAKVSANEQQLRDLSSKGDGVEELGFASRQVAKLGRLLIGMGPEMLKGAAATAAGAAVPLPGTGLAAGTAFWAYESAPGLFWQIKETAKAAGVEVSDEEAKAWALTYAVPLGLTNAVSLEGMGASFTKWATSKPLIEQLVTKLLPGSVERVLAARGMTGVLGRAAANYGTHLFQGGLMMAGQQGISSLASEVAKSSAGGEFSPGAVEDALVSGFVTGLEDFALLSAWGPMRRYIADRGRLAASLEHAQVLKDIGENTRESKLAQRDGPRFQQLLNKFGPEKRVYVELEMVDKVAQEKRIEGGGRELAAGIMGDGGAAYDAAKAKGGDLAVPVGNWAEKVAKSGLDEKLAPYARLNLSDLSPARAIEAERALAEKLKKDAEARGPGFEFEQRTLRDRVEEALIAAGHDRRVARSNADNLTGYVTSVALQAETSVREALIRTGLPKLKLEGQTHLFDALKKDFNLTEAELAEVEKIASIVPAGKAPSKPKGVTVSAKVATAKQEVLAVLPDLGESALNDIKAARSAAKTAEQAAAVERLARLAYGDTLTPAGNKAAYLDFMSRPREGVHVALDLNDFKSVNDLFGHAVGDKAIGMAGSVFSQASRANRGKLFRPGGDEFHAFFETDEQARGFIEAATKGFNELGPVKDEHRLSFAAGIGKTAEEADLASMDAKAAKREKHGDVRQGNAKPGHGESFASYAAEVKTREAVVEKLAENAAVPEPRSRPNPRAEKELSDRFESWLKAKLSEDGFGQVLNVEITDDHRIDLWPDFIEDVKATEPDLLMAYWGSTAESKGATYFASGTNDPGEIKGMVRAGQHVGVAVPAVSARGMAVLKALRGLDIKVFADSGAFGEVEKTFPFNTKKEITHEEWVKRLAKYKELAQELGSQLYIVAPDRVARQKLTLERLGKYAKEVRELRELGANIIVPLQRAFGPDGETMTTAQFFAEATKTLGLDDIIAGIPSKKAASTVEDIAAFVAEAKPERVHLLGLGTKAPGGRFEKVINAIANASPETKVFADSVMLAGMKVTGRGSFTDMKNEYKRLGMEPGADLNEAATHEAVTKRQAGGQEPQAARDLKSELTWVRSDTLRDAMRRQGLVPTEAELERVAHESPAKEPEDGDPSDTLEQARKLGSREQRAKETAQSAGEAEAMRTTRDWEAPVAAKRFEKMFPNPKVAGRILDFGAGREARAQQRLLGLGYQIDAHDLWAVRDPEVAALGLHLTAKEFADRAGTYDTVVSSNVINVQGDQGMMDAYLRDVKGAMKDSGVFVANLPETPRKGWYAGDDIKAQNAQLKAELQKHFREVEQSGPSNNPVFVARKPIRDVAPQPGPRETHRVRAFEAVRAHLSPADLKLTGRDAKYAGKSKFAGQCSVATNALFHLLGGDKGEWKEMMIRRADLDGEDTHYFLQHKVTGEILDPTAEQFEGQPIPYDRARGAGRQQPGKWQGLPLKAAQPLLNRIKLAEPELVDSLRQDRRAVQLNEKFRAWFNGSKVVDADGEPVVAYHGTSKDADFKSFKVGQRGSWFTSDPAHASEYARSNDSKGPVFRGGELVDRNNADRVLPVYLSIKNPYRLTPAEEAGMRSATNYAAYQREVFGRARAQGYDGVDMGGGTWVVFDPKQVKSVFNKGEFNPEVADILRQEERGFMRFKVGETGRPRDFDIHALAGDKSTLAHELMHWMSWSMHDLAMRADTPESLRGDYLALLRFGGWDGVEARLKDSYERARLAAVKEPRADQLDRLRELRAKEEKLSHAWEQFLMEGRAPSRELNGSFYRFRRWMLDLYGDVQGVDKQYYANYGQHIELSDEVRGVFSRMLAVEGEVGRQQGEAANYDLAGVLNLSPEEQAQLDKLHEASAQKAREHLDRETAKSDKEAISDAMQGERERLRAEVHEEVSGTNPYVVVDFLTSGELRNPETGHITAPEKLPKALLGDDGGPMRLSYKDALRVAGKETADAARRKGLTVEEGGASADELAGLFGFKDGKELVDVVAGAPDKAAVVEQETTRRFEEAFGPRLKELSDALRAVGHDAIHSPPDIDRALRLRDVLAREIGLAPKLGGRLPKEVLKRNVERQMRQSFVKDISPKYHLDAERRSAKKAFELAMEASRARKSGQHEEADRLYTLALHEQDNVILNKLQWREATRMLKELERAERKMDGAAKMPWGQRLGKADIAYADGHDAILSALGFKEAHENATPARFEEMLAKMKEDGGEVVALLPDATETAVPGAGPREPVLEAALWDSTAIRRLLKAPSDWQHVTADEALNAVTAIENIRATAANQNKIKIAQKAATRLSLIEATRESISRLKTAGSPADRDVLHWRAFTDKLKTKATSLDANLTEVSALVDRIVNGDHEHPLWKLFVEERQKARLEEYQLGQRFADRITKMWQELPKELRKGKRKIVDGLVEELPMPSYGGIINPNSPRSRSWMWMVALNLGNEGNMERLLAGTGWTEMQVRSALAKHMTAAEWHWVQGVWDALADLYPHIERVHIADTGLRPDKVRAKPFFIETADGQIVELAGGYFPARYDPRVPSKNGIGEKQEAAAIEGLVGNNFRPPRLVTDHVNKRAEKNADLINLEFGVVPNHVLQVIHYVSHQQYVKQVAGVVLDKDFKTLVSGHMGIEYQKQFPAWVRAIANQYAFSAADSMNVPNGLLSWAKSRATLAAVGFNVAVPMADFTNPLLPVLRGDLSAKHLARVTAQLAGNYREMRDFALEKSIELKLRANHGNSLGIDVDRVVRSKGTLGEVEHAAYWMMEASDRWTATPVWLAKYGELLEKGMDADKAAKEADWVVQKYFPSSDMASRAALLRDKGAWGYLTFLYGYGNKVYNLNRATILHAWDAVRDGSMAKADKAQAIGFALFAMTAQAALIGGVGDFITGHGPKENAPDDERWKKWGISQAIQYVEYNVPFLNVLTGGRGALPATGVATKLEKELKESLTGDNSAVESLAALGSLAVGAVGQNQLMRTSKYAGTHLADDLRRGHYRRSLSNLLYGERGAITPINVGADR